MPNQESLSFLNHLSNWKNEIKSRWEGIEEVTQHQGLDNNKKILEE